jgi:hypothetical protein
VRRKFIVSRNGRKKKAEKQLKELKERGENPTINI